MTLLRVCVLFTFGFAVVGQESDSPVFQYETKPAVLVVRMVAFSNLGSGRSILGVFGDGRVLTQKVDGNKEVNHEFYLHQSEVQDLLRVMSDHGAMTYPYGIIRQRIQAEANRVRTETNSDRIEHKGFGFPSDGTTVKTEVFLALFKSSEAESQAQPNFYHLSGGYAVDYVARTSPEVKEATDLAILIKRLSALSKDVRRKPLSPEEAKASLPVDEPLWPE